MNTSKRYKVKFKKTLAFIFINSVFMTALHAQHTVMLAVVPDSGETSVLATIIDRNCEAAGWNASIGNTTETLRGCWQREGDLVKIKIPNSDVVRVIPFHALKSIGLTRPPQTQKSEEPKKPTTTTLSCAADAWFGDIVVERNSDGTLKSLTVSGEAVSATEVSNSLNFSFKGLNISLSTLTGAFNYETSGFQRYLNNRLLGGGSAKGSGICKINNLNRQF